MKPGVAAGGPGRTRGDGRAGAVVPWAPWHVPSRLFPALSSSPGLGDPSGPSARTVGVWQGRQPRPRSDLVTHRAAAGRVSSAPRRRAAVPE